MRTSHRTLLMLLGVVLLVACANIVPREGWKKSYGPVVPHDTFPADCALCHEGGSWSKIKADFKYDHLKETGVALNGAHDTTQCLLCHNDRGPVKQFADRGCRGCHEDVHKGRLGVQCIDCHSEINWKPVEQIAQHMRTRFPLVGAHASTDCTACHARASEGVFAGAVNSCEGCHSQDSARSTTINHAALGLTDRCDRCHNAVAWLPAGFSHPETFPLSGGHATPSCTSCHTTPGVFTGLSVACASCHQTDFQQTADPNHTNAGFSTNCTQCHTINTWQGATFQHTQAFPLTNAHAGRGCAECHTTPGVYSGQSSACSACHLDDFQRTTAPNHVTGGFSTNCTDCHNTARWFGATFTHPSSFPLTNGHANQACNVCHTTPGVYTGQSTACASCHLDDFQATTDPNHVAGGFSTTCTQCHNTVRWLGATFTHTSTFPLTNGHSNRACSACHTTPGVFTGQSTACSSCHLDDYQRTTNPNHVGLGYSTTCTDCHNTSQWQGATFQHTQTFPLTNGHAGVSCTNCHTTPGVYTGQSTACSSCHLDDYQQTTSPAHVGAGFPTNCTQCHNTTQWLGAVFNHPAAFPLTNGHAGRTCSACHTTPGVYTGESTACASCHLNLYQAAPEPNHTAAGFSTTCNQCHNTSVWSPANYQHTTRFPLANAHGGHACAECHTTGVYIGQPSACSACHLDDYQGATNPNHVQSGYPTTCQTCHTPTAWANGTFTHPRINRGNHSNLRCVDCHTVPAATPAFSCTHCHEHSRANTDNDHNGVNGYQYLSSACYNCHD